MIDVSPAVKREFSEPTRLGLFKAFEIVGAPVGQTFFYRKENRRIIEMGWHDPHRLRGIRGPLLYVVTDYQGVVRYTGKWVTDTPLYQRWFRHSYISHHPNVRNRIIEEIDAGRKPLAVWSASASEIRQTLMPEEASDLTDRELVEQLEVRWISGLKQQLWNRSFPRTAVALTDGDYWKAVRHWPTSGP